MTDPDNGQPTPTGITTIAAESEEQNKALRDSHRKRVLQSAVIAFHGRHTTLDGAVRDISDTGARIRVSDPMLVPDEFVLLIDLEGLEVDCEIAWRTDKEIGAHFLTPPKKVAVKRKQTVVEDKAPERPSLLRKPLSSLDI